jgi:MFS family permease
METSRAFNTPTHNPEVDENPQTSPIDIFPASHGEEKHDDEEDGMVSRGTTGSEDAGSPIGASETDQPPPDGGLTAWLQVLTGHLMNISTWGTINSYGLFLAHYASPSSPGTHHLSSSTLAWPAGIQTFLLCFVGVFSGRALDAGYFRLCVALGLLFQVLGMFLTSLSTQFWQVLLAQGFVMGLGHGLVFTPTVGSVGQWFVRKRAVAMGIILSGSVTGGIIFPALANGLVERIGWGWTVRVMGFVMLFDSVVILALARARIAPRKSGPLVELSAFKELPYALFAVGTWCVLWPVYYAYDYVSTIGTWYHQWGSLAYILE